MGVIFVAVALNLSLYSTAPGVFCIQQSKVEGVVYATGGIGLEESP